MSLESRVELILQNILGASNEVDPESRVEKLLQNLIEVAYIVDPMSRVELLLENLQGGENEVIPQSRVEMLIANALGATYEVVPQSRVEELLVLLAEQYATEYKTLTGAIVTFDDAVPNEPFKQLVVDIDPVQDLHGYSSPWVGGGSSNKWDEQWEAGSLSWTGTNTTVSNKIRSKNHIPVVEGETYRVVTSNSLQFFYYDSSKAFVSYEQSSKANGATITIPTGCAYLRFYTYGTTYGETYKNDIAINYPSTVTTYSPYENICPISGWTGMQLKAMGKNLLDPTLLKDQAAWNTIRFYAPVGTPLTFSTNQTTRPTSGLIVFFSHPTESMTATNNVYVNHPVTRIVRDVGYVEIVQRNADSLTSFADWEYQIEIGDEVVTPYEPYQGQTIPISWQTEAGTVYGGRLDVLSGVLTVTYETCKVRDLSWSYFNTALYASKPDTQYGLEIVDVRCDRYKTVAAVSGLGNATAWLDGTIRGNSSKRAYIYIKDTAYTSGADFKNANGDMDIIYPLATPTTYQLTPHEIRSLLGQNNIWADTGNVTVEYKAYSNGG